MPFVQSEWFSPSFHTQNVTGWLCNSLIIFTIARKTGKGVTGRDVKKVFQTEAVIEVVAEIFWAVCKVLCNEEL